MKGEYIFKSGSWECEIWDKDIYLIDYKFDFCFIIPGKVDEIYNQTLINIRHGGSFHGQFEKNIKDFLKVYLKGKKVKI